MGRVELFFTAVALCVGASLAIGSARPLTASGQEQKAPVPAASALASARERVRNTYANDYAQAGSPAGKQQLARALLEESQRLAGDPVARYALLIEAHDQAVEAADCETALDAIERMHADFEPIYRAALRRAAVVRIAPAVKQAQIGCIASVGLELAAACLQLDDAPGAGEILRAISQPIRKYAEPDAKVRLKAVEEELADVQRFCEALETFSETPDDPEANRVIGLHHAFCREDIERGVVFLARAPDGPLKSCAALDAANPAEAAARIALGDAWLAWSRKPNLKSAWFSGAQLDEARACELARSRAIHWYTLAAEELPELERLPVLDKIAAARATAAPTPSTAPAKAAPRRSKTPEIDAAVQRALAWLAAHRSDDGSWDCDGFVKSCGELGSSRCDGAGSPNHDVGVTGLALLAFLRAGPALADGRHDDVIRAGLEWLARQQDAEGCFGKRLDHAFLYDHACAALAMTEACRSMESETFRRSAQGALAFTCRAQNPYSAWRYNVPPDGDNDTSITGWMVMVLKEARLAGFPVEDAVFENAVAWVDQMTNPANGRTGYTGMGLHSARLPALLARFPAENTEALTGVGIAVRLASGRTPKDDAMVSKGAALMLLHPPRWEETGHIDFYYWYYGTLALSQLGGKGWERWSSALQTAVLDHQHVDAKQDRYGSWDPVDAWSTEGGRVYATALNCMTLEAFYP